MRSTKCALSAALAFAASSVVPARGETPVTATVITAEEEIPSQPGVELAATLRLPSRACPCPVLVLQPGAGPAARGAWPGLHALLNRRGIATLEFDKRGVGRSTGTFTDTLDETEADMSAIVAWLRKRNDIDSAGIALLGHSQGAAAIPAVAERDGRIAAIVFMSGPVGERGTMILDAMRAEIVGGGVPPKVAERIVASARDWLEARSAKQDETTIAAAKARFVTAMEDARFPAIAAVGMANGLDTAQFLSMYEQETAAPLKALKIPVLAIFGGRDEHVDRRYAAAAAVDILADNPQALVVEVPGASHNYLYRPADAPPRTTPPGGRYLFPEGLIADWLARTLTPATQP